MLFTLPFFFVFVWVISLKVALVFYRVKCLLTSCYWRTSIYSEVGAYFQEGDVICMRFTTTPKNPSYDLFHTLLTVVTGGEA